MQELHYCITGSNGFSGLNVAKFLCQKNKKVLGLSKKRKITKLKGFYKSFYLNLKSDKNLILNCFGPSFFIFNIQLYLLEKKIEINFVDNFSSFKNTLIQFSKLIRKKKTNYNFNETSEIIKTLIKLKKLK